VSERNADNGWYPLLAWQLALNLTLAAGMFGTVGEISEKIRAEAEKMARAIEKANT
jgi:hypothetical protein